MVNLSVILDKSHDTSLALEHKVLFEKMSLANSSMPMWKSCFKLVTMGST